MNLSIISECKIGEGTIIHNFVNLYGCSIGENSMIGSFVEIQKGVVVGNLVKIQSHSFICEGVEIEDEVFVGHHVVFTNDKYPKAAKNGKLVGSDDWTMQNTLVKKGASIGSNATILPGITIGEGAVVGAGSVVVRDVKAHSVVVGNPATEIHI
ncbi:MAG: hypothetical protein QG583_390 [Patescibacteria group bacterium]|jgi:acetyltransferase-like isoleucine patch superfamily enzyme|nr:hypothetical protein [Patescibacteria group bacterium]